MTPSGRRVAAALLCAALVPASTDAQTPLRNTALIGGVEVRTYSFASPLPVRRITQSATPIGIVATLGRLSIDIGTYWAATSLTRSDGGYRRVTGFTDTQARLAWAIGQERAVASMVVNLPTGIDRMTPADFEVLGAVSSPFLGFPVNAYANGGSVTVALAGAMSAGSWNVGLAGSGRASRTFTPVVDPVAGPLNYRAGIEGRIRLGIDRLLGQSRVALGLTLSGFGDDVYAGLGVARGAYQPGLRWIAEGLASLPAGNGTLTATLWGYQRSAGDTAGVSLENQENLAGLTLTGVWPLAPRVSLEPGAEFRYSGLDGGSGLLAGGGMGARFRVTERVSAWSGFRHDRGYLDAKTVGEGGELEVNRTSLNTWHLSAFVRVTW